MKLKSVVSGLVCALLLAQPVAAKSFKELFPETYDTIAEPYLPLVDSLDMKTGTVSVGDGMATLELGEEFYFLNATDAATVLIDLWGNPDATGTLGMVFPMGYAPVGNGWGIEISFDPVGYVSDEDAQSINFDELLQQMREDIVEENKDRVANGYEEVQLLGWAEAPHYDQQSRQVYWAKELHFSSMDEGDNTLNYFIRALGRRGVLQLNFIADMGQLSEIQSAVPQVLSMVEFTQGNRYIDFDPSVDTVAAVGIGGLIAGKIAAKTGLLAVALVFLKKFWFLIFVPFLWLKNKFKRNPEA